MADYLPQIQHASECHWAYRRDALDPARAREASLLREAQVAREQVWIATGRRWFRWLRGADARPVSPSRFGAARPLDGAA